MRLAALFLLVLVGPAPLSAESPARSTTAAPGEWRLHGRTWDEQRHSPLKSIHADNVAGLGLAWSYAIGSQRGVEATPLVADGVLYATGPWSVVFALDAASGVERWRFDPQVPKSWGRYACCDVVNRGVALREGRVYVGTIDGRLIALDASTGALVWDVQTTDESRPYTITGAPRVVKDMIVIGNGGADLGVRGYVSAYDAVTGALRWRFYTVPASKDGPHEHEELERAAETWSKDAVFESGLGGTVWDSMVYDPELDLLYVGTGNSTIYNRKLRSPGGGDNLFLATILALRPDTGRLVWHYQTTPGEHWDYTATQHLMLADLELDGKPRRVILQAPKNGFFYVLDRVTGELLAADKFALATWASHVDPRTGRPVERPAAVWEDEAAMVAPGPPGAHSWHPMSFHPGTGYVYIPALEMVYRYEPDLDFRYTPGRWNTSEDVAGLSAMVEGYEAINLLPCSPAKLVAWDVAAKERAWVVDNETAVPGGVLSTAGDLVFQGSGAGELVAYHARTGERLWASPRGVGITAPPITYQLGGVQYVVVLTGIGGSHGGHFTRMEVVNEGRVLAFALGGKAPFPAPVPRPAPVVAAPRLDSSATVLAKGRAAYAESCMFCHGTGAISSGLYPDLRHAAADVWSSWDDIVLGGVRADRGMASFADRVDREQSQAIRAYVASRAHAEPNLAQRLFQRAVESPLCIDPSWLAD